MPGAGRRARANATQVASHMALLSALLLAVAMVADALGGTESQQQQEEEVEPSPLRPRPPFRGWAFGSNLTNTTLYPPGTINFVPTGPPVKSHNTPCDSKCFAKQGVALLGWSYFWYPASPDEKANRTAWVDAYKQQLDPLRHGNQLPGLDLEAGVGMDECAGSQNATIIAIATEGWRAARRTWPDNFVGAWWAGGCPDEMFIELMLDGTFDLAMIEG